MSYHEKLYVGLKKFKEAKKACKKDIALPNPGTAADFWKQHAEFYADLCDLKDEKIKELEQKLKNQKRISEVLDSCWHAAAQWGELDTDSEVWPDEIAELEKLGYYEKE